MARESCKGCFYLRPLGTRGSNWTACHYSLFENRLRPCPAEKCTVKIVLSKSDADVRTHIQRHKLHAKIIEND